MPESIAPRRTAPVHPLSAIHPANRLPSHAVQPDGTAVRRKIRSRTLLGILFLPARQRFPPSDPPHKVSRQQRMRSLFRTTVRRRTRRRRLFRHDYIVPVPLHKRKLRRRGFNQSEWIAAGISAYTRIPVRTDLLEHRRENESQTRKGIYTRWLNTRDVFHAPHTPGIEGCHLLLIDDVVTTGATISACAESLQKSNRVKISVLTLAIAR